MSIINTVTAVLTILSTAMTIYITYVSSRIDSQIKLNELRLREFQAHLDERMKTADLALRTTIEERAAHHADDAFNLQIYEKVYVALQDNDRRKHEVAYALVQSLADEHRLKRYLLGLFQASVVSRDTRDSAAAALFRIEQASHDTTAEAAAPGESKKVSYDVFWCEGTAEWEHLAAAAAERIRAQEGAGRVRTRMLPTAVNKQGRFRVAGLTIRVDPGEDKLGEQLKGWIDPAVAPRGFKLDRSVQPTPSYLSAFVCGAP
jgi:hypothetical protein